MGVWKSKEAWVVALMLLAGPVAAFEGGALTCRFTVECFDAEGCEETDYEAALELRGDGAVLVDVSEEVPLQAIETDGTTAWVGHANGAVRLLTGLEGETARLSVHQAAGDLMLNYTGICEVAD